MRSFSICSRFGWLLLGVAAFALGWWTGGWRRLAQETATASSRAETAPKPVPLRSVIGEASPTTAPAGLSDLSSMSPAETWKTLAGLGDMQAREAAIRAQLARLPVAEWQAWFNELARRAEEQRATKADLEATASDMMTVNAMMNAIASLDPVGFMRHVHSRGERNNDSEQEARLLVMMAWTRRQPEEATRFLREQLVSGSSLPGLDDDSAKHMAALLVGQDAEGAFAWIASLPENYRAAPLRYALTALAAHDPAQAAGKLTALQDMPNFDNLAGEIAKRWSRQDPAAALAWAVAQEGEAGRRAVVDVASQWAATDFDAALRELTAAGAMEAALPSLIAKAPDARLAEMAHQTESVADPSRRAEASAAIMRVWTHKNPEEASAWMARQPAGEIRDQAIAAFVRWADVRDPEAGLLWAASMTDAAKRQEAIGHIISQLGDRAPTEVGPWLESNTTLTEDERAAVRQRLERGR